MNFKKGSTNTVRNIANEWISGNMSEISDKIECGLPEYDDRLKVWRITLKPVQGITALGEIQIDEKMTKIVDFPNKKIIIDRLKKSSDNKKTKKQHEKTFLYLRRFQIR